MCQPLYESVLFKGGIVLYKEKIICIQIVIVWYKAFGEHFVSICFSTRSFESSGLVSDSFMISD